MADFKDRIDISWGSFKAQNSLFRLHNHRTYEIYIYISGDAEFHVEGSVFELAPYDILFVCPDEMHRVWHNSETMYNRIIFNVPHSYFENNNITRYEEILRANSATKQCKISGTDTVKSGIKDTVNKLVNCISKGETVDSPIVNSLFIEMLYTMCNIDNFDTIIGKNSKVQSAIDYININFKNPITLDDVSDNIFISKYHLCRMFKNATGYTVNGYINHRRLMYVEELLRTGNYNLKEASMEAGFGSYTNFYRLYKNENKISPKAGIK